MDSEVKNQAADFGCSDAALKAHPCVIHAKQIAVRVGCDEGSCWHQCSENRFGATCFSKFGLRADVTPCSSDIDCTGHMKPYLEASKKRPACLDSCEEKAPQEKWNL